MDLRNNVTLVRIANQTEENLTKVQNTYISSFPETERRDFVLFCRLIAEEPVFKLFTILIDSKYAGFITCWQFSEFVYVEHFAIDENMRSGGIGSIAMQSFLTLIDCPVVLEVEDIVDDLTARRVRFYETLGFKLHSQDYKQPPYREKDSWYDMKLMSFGGFDLDSQYESVRNFIYSHVYNVKNPD